MILVIDGWRCNEVLWMGFQLYLFNFLWKYYTIMYACVLNWFKKLKKLNLQQVFSKTVLVSFLSCWLNPYKYSKVIYEHDYTLMIWLEIYNSIMSLE